MKTNKSIMKIIFFLSFLPAIIIIVISIYYAAAGHAYYDQLEPGKVSHVAYGLEEFVNSILYYGGYLSLHIPILQICIVYQVCYFKFKNKGEL